MVGFRDLLPQKWVAAAGSGLRGADGPGVSEARATECLRHVAFGFKARPDSGRQIS